MQAITDGQRRTSRQHTFEIGQILTTRIGLQSEEGMGDSLANHSERTSFMENPSAACEIRRSSALGKKKKKV
jgi:hypothetical protein